MVKIKTLNPKKSKMLPYIKKHGVSEFDVAQCLGMSGSWFSSRLNQNKFGRKDEATIKKVVDYLAKRGDNK